MKRDLVDVWVILHAVPIIILSAVFGIAYAWIFGGRLDYASSLASMAVYLALRERMKRKLAEKTA